MPGGLPIDCESERKNAETGVPWNGQQCGVRMACESVIGEYSLGLTPNEPLMPLLELVQCGGGKVDTTFQDLENSYVGWVKRWA